MRRWFLFQRVAYSSFWLNNAHFIMRNSPNKAINLSTFFVSIEMQKNFFNNGKVTIDGNTITFRWFEIIQEGSDWISSLDNLLKWRYCQKTAYGPFGREHLHKALIWVRDSIKILRRTVTLKSVCCRKLRTAKRLFLKSSSWSWIWKSLVSKSLLQYWSLPNYVMII